MCMLEGSSLKNLLLHWATLRKKSLANISNVHVPSFKWLIEVSGTPEHRFHVSNFTYIPNSNGLIKADSLTKHRTHVSYTTYVPTLNRSIETGSTPEHRFHISNAADVPSANGLIKCSSKPKHWIHAINFTNIPRTNRLIEAVCEVEHRSHGGDFTDVPALNKLIKVIIPIKQPIHSTDRTYIPAVDDSVHLHSFFLAGRSWIPNNSFSQLIIAFKLKSTTFAATTIGGIRRAILELTIFSAEIVLLVWLSELQKVGLHIKTNNGTSFIKGEWRDYTHHFNCFHRSNET